MPNTNILHQSSLLTIIQGKHCAQHSNSTAPLWPTGAASSCGCLDYNIPRSSAKAYVELFRSNSAIGLNPADTYQVPAILINNLCIR